MLPPFVRIKSSIASNPIAAPAGVVARRMLLGSWGGTRGSLSQPRGLALGPKRVWPPRLRFQKENGFGCYA